MFFLSSQNSSHRILNVLIVVLLGGALSSCGSNPSDYLPLPKPHDTISAQSRSDSSDADEFYPAVVFSDTPEDAYDEGYTYGYEQGEYDAKHGLGFEANYDDSNDYTGQLKQKYEEGVEDGYTEGFEYSEGIDEEE